MEYVWGLHNFVADHDDEIEFRAGERITVVEKDELYQDGWWRGTNTAGKTGLFPEAYTSKTPPTLPGTISSSSARSSGGPLSALPEDEEPESSPEAHSEHLHQQQSLQKVLASASAGAAVQEHDGNRPGSGTVMHATMTDIQEAIEQLGVRNQVEDTASRSFSFASTKDATTDDEDFSPDKDNYDYEQPWDPKDARKKLAQNAEKQTRKEAVAASKALHTPPIDVEMSDESEDEGDHHGHFPFAALSELSAPPTATYATKEFLPEDTAAIETPTPARTITNGHARQPSEATIAQPQPRYLFDAESSIIPDSPKSAEARNSSSDASTLARIIATSTPGMAAARAAPLPASPAPPLPSSPAPAFPIAATVPSLAAIPTAVPQNTLAPTPPAPVLTSAPGRAMQSSPAPISPISPSDSVQANGPPNEWNVDQVVTWLKSKNFDDGVCAKFIEHEITGDVLLELDANLLKEVDIIAFGKRMRIAHAISELRRPASFISSAPSSGIPPQFHGYGRSATDDDGTVRSMSGTPSVSGLLWSPESAPHTGDIMGTPSSAGKMYAEQNAVNRAVKSRPANLALVGSENAPKALLTGTSTAASGGIPEVVESRPSQDDESHNIENDASSNPRGLRSPNSGHGFGRSAGGSISSINSVINSSASTVPTSTTSTIVKSKRGSKDSAGSKSPIESDSKDVARPRERAGAALKTSKSDGSGRHSFFGGTLGKTRKPAPRYSEVSLESNGGEPGGKPSRSLSRLYLSAGSGGGSQRVRGTGSTPPSSGALSRGSAAVSPDSPVQGPGRTRELPQGSPIGPDGISQAPLNLTSDKSVLEQIGQPDREGWLRKRGERYNTWKLRYFLLKGPHLYYMKSKTETRLKGYINIKGYRMISDENVNPGKYGFRIIHDTGASHFFSSDEQGAVREWMKSLMKATIGRDYSQPVMSSVNIPTIPLTVAQAMSPAPRPPSPTARDATQRALRRENPNQLSSRDARILMGLPSEPEGANVEMTAPQTPVTPGTPSRPAKDSGRPDTRRNMSIEHAHDAELVQWINQHISNTSHKATDMSTSLSSGLVLYRLAESIKASPTAAEVPDSIFPQSPTDERLDGLFVLFDFLLDNDIRMGSVTINDVRSGDRDQLVVLVRALKAWEEKRLSLERSLAKGANVAGPFVA